MNRKAQGMKRIASIIIIATLLASTSVLSASAARIYNELPNSVKIILEPKVFLKLGPGERSVSLEWKNLRSLTVDAVPSSFVTVIGTSKNSPVQLCAMNFGLFSDIQGGNYMTIGYNGHRFVCTTCNSKHQVMHQASSEASESFVERRITRTGC